VLEVFLKKVAACLVFECWLRVGLFLNFDIFVAHLYYLITPHYSQLRA